MTSVPESTVDKVNYDKDTLRGFLNLLRGDIFENLEYFSNNEIKKIKEILEGSELVFQAEIPADLDKTIDDFIIILKHNADQLRIKIENELTKNIEQLEDIVD